MKKTFNNIISIVDRCVCVRNGEMIFLWDALHFQASSVARLFWHYQLHKIQNTKKKRFIT